MHGLALLVEALLDFRDAAFYLGDLDARPDPAHELLEEHVADQGFHDVALQLAALSLGHRRRRGAVLLDHRLHLGHGDGIAVHDRGRPRRLLSKRRSPQERKTSQNQTG